MRKSTIKLTKKEFDFISSKEYPITKRAVIQKFCQRFDEMGMLFRQKLVSKNIKLSAELAEADFKTTRGENYQSLPYVVLDYPKIKEKEFTLLCRTHFWWGKYISLSVMFKADEFELKNFANKLKNSIYKKIKLYNGKDIWQQDLSDTHFIKLYKFSEAELYATMQTQLYVKLSVKVSFKNLDELEERAVAFYNEILNTFE